ncbi:MAG: GTP-binding protein [Planctomycetes bacterium]|nr:GTP-binding protein [Planctomycetota bacterium]
MTPTRVKVCMLGSFAVGKTSLVQRYVKSLFSERYQTTIGVQIDKKELVIDGRPLTIMLWDLYGEDEFQKLSASFLRGAHGAFFVADGTRAQSVDHALELAERFAPDLGDGPRILLVNKHDLAAQWEVRDETLARLRAKGWLVLCTSAKDGENVERAFELLARAMLERESD